MSSVIRIFKLCFFLFYFIVKLIVILVVSNESSEGMEQLFVLPL